MRKPLIAILATTLLVSTAAAVQLDMVLKDGSGETVDTRYKVLQDGNLVTSSQDTLNATLTENQNYTVKQQASTQQGWYNVTYHDLNATQDLSPATQLTKASIPDQKTFLTNRTKLYTVQTENMDFRKAEMRLSVRSQPNQVAHCTAYDFQASECNDWNVNTTADYASSYSDPVFEFNVTSFDGYAAGTTAPYPNITEVRIYDVSDTLDNRAGGELVEKGLNETFTVAQHSPSEYRFEFSVFNNGSEPWTLESADTLYEEGLDPGWTVSDIWYRIGKNRDGGTFSEGRVDWQTGNGGQLDVTGDNDTMEAAFVLDLGLDSTVTTDNLFSVMDSSSGTGSTDEHRLKFRDLGDLNVTLEEPPNGTMMPKGHFFTVNASVTCQGGYCGEVRATPRYNTSEGYSVIPQDSGTPFYTNRSPENLCGALSASETCHTSWKVNATGPLESWHRIDVNSSSNYTEIPEADSAYSEIQINQMVMMNLTWDTTNFGYIDPGEQDKPATGNSKQTYNITISEESMKVDNLYVKGSDLVSRTDSDYRIGITNLTMTTELSSTNHTVRNEYSRILQDISPGTSINTKYWLDAPTGIVQGGYTGSITFKANATG